jgi:hypothetical protein
MTHRLAFAALAAVALAVSVLEAGDKPKHDLPQFQTSDRCFACHNGLSTSSGQDVSIGFNWRASIMANSSRDPYWQASVRRETLDHPEAKAEIEDECAICHMPIVRYEAKIHGKTAEVFSHLPLNTDTPEDRQASDGVSCAVCHQITPDNFGKPESFVGGFIVKGPDETGTRAEYGPFDIDKGHVRIMRTSSEGYRPEKGDHIRDSELCATCHTLITKALGPGGTVIGALHEQMPYQEWVASDYRTKQSCQACHMPAIEEPVQITKVLGEPREGVRQHVFVGGNFLLEEILNRYRAELAVVALPQELTAASLYTRQYLQTKAATVALENVALDAGRLSAEVVIRNKNGHKLPTAYPSRRAWVHFTVRDRNGSVVFESGALKPDGSIAGNDNDADPLRFEPHYTEVRNAEEVQIYESILGDSAGRVTTGLLNGVRYLKDNRMLPDGFDKRKVAEEIAVFGGAMEDADFQAGGDRVRYSVDVGNAQGPFTVEADLMYQPVGFRWANNLKQYDAAEPRRFAAYYDSMQSSTAVRMAGATATR